MFDVYNELMMLNGLEPFPEDWYRGLRASMTALGRWCAEQDIDAQTWVLAKHEATGWRFRIGPKKLVKTTAKFMESFRSFGDMKQAETLDQMSMQGTAITDTGGLVLGETLKRTWVSTPDTCRTAPETIYLPDSQWCQGCSMIRRCNVGG